MKRLFLLFAIVCFAAAPDVLAQPTSIFAAPKFKKIEKGDMPSFERRFRPENNLTGRGMHLNETIDGVPTMELRARLQSAFGHPTRTVLDLIGNPNFREAQYIQFEYWFVINDSIPMVLLDTSGPFSTGLTYGGLARYVDLMPEVKRELNKVLMGVTQLGEYTDYYYALDERDKTKGQAIPNGWYLVKYQGGKFSSDPTSPPRRN